MNRKVFISFLGGSNYGACHYCRDGYKSHSVRYIQEATIDYLNSSCPWTEHDVALILLTRGAEAKNWVDNGHIDFNTKETIIQAGLKTRLEQMNLPQQIKPIKNLPDGNNEEEIWDIFTQVFSEIQENDELYFDLTHGFRYLPMLALVLGNYAKFLKNVTVKSLTYGNFEGRDRETQEAQIIDLLPLTNLQDWTYASATFLENGNVKKLVETASSTYKPLLKESKGADANAKALQIFTNALNTCVEDFQTCRGLNIVRSKNLQSLKDSITKVESTAIAPLRPVITKIGEAIYPFDSKENILNGFHAAKWCLSNGLYQQSATILQETVTSFVADRHGIPVDDDEKRGLVNSAFAIKINNMNEECWKVDDESIATVKEILTDTIFDNQELLNSFAALTDVRNDINHSGMRKKRTPMQASSIRKSVEICVNRFYELIVNTYAD